MYHRSYIAAFLLAKEAEKKLDHTAVLFDDLGKVLDLELQQEDQDAKLVKAKIAAMQALAEDASSDIAALILILNESSRDETTTSTDRAGIV